MSILVQILCCVALRGNVVNEPVLVSIDRQAWMYLVALLHIQVRDCCHQLAQVGRRDKVGDGDGSGDKDRYGDGDGHVQLLGRGVMMAFGNQS